MESAVELKGLSGRTLSWFLSHGVTRSIFIITSGWDAASLQANPSSLSISSGFPDSSLLPTYAPGWREARTMRSILKYLWQAVTLHMTDHCSAKLSLHRNPQLIELPELQ